MKCPKCGYLGFEHVERCRNCGYDFSLAPAQSLPELSIRDGGAAEENPFGDLALVDAALPRVGQSSSVAAGTRGAKGKSGFSAQPATPTGELPLFGEPFVDDAPLITKASPPRAPLAVRRATPEVPRLRSEAARAPMLDLAQDVDGEAARRPLFGRSLRSGRRSGSNTPSPNPRHLSFAARPPSSIC